jgi:N-acetylglutamate synthase-like GNAT family acetyltransferase
VAVADIRLRLALNADASVLADLFRRSSLSNAGDRASLLAHSDSLEFSDDALKEHRVRVALVDDRIVGLATVVATGQVGELEDLFVDPDWMRRGVGRALVVDAIDNAQDQDADRCS